MTQGAAGVYNQTFQHDAFGNTTNRQSVIWSEFDNFSATWVNGRNQNPVWQYDANGAVRFDDYFEYTNDAKGVNAKVRNLNDNVWTTQTVNPEGLMTKRTTGSGTATISTTFYLRSTVLGGKVVAEYNSAAQQQKRFAYLNGDLLATDDANNFSLEHSNPLTGARGKSLWTGMGGGYYATAEPDSSGVVDVGFSDPNEVPPLPPEEPDIASIVGGLSGECRVQGIQSTFGCWLVRRMLARQTALRCPNDDCDAHLITVTQTIGGKLAATSRFFVTEGDPGWNGTLDGTYGWVLPTGRSDMDLNDPNEAKTFVGLIPYLLQESLTRVGTQQVGSPAQNPNNNGTPMTDAEIALHRAAVAELLEDPTCKSFVTGVLSRIGEGERTAFSGNLLTIFQEVSRVKGWKWKNAADMNFDLGQEEVM